jgi:hypothetical protein
MKKIMFEKGSLLVEIIIVIGIIVGALGAILGFVAFSFVNSGIVQQTNEAVALSEEMFEALRNHRDSVGWDDDDTDFDYDGLGVMRLVGGDFHLEKSTDPTPRWMIIAGEETIREFTRKMEFTQLDRDADEHIVPSGTGVSDDPGSVQVTVTVEWNERGRTHQIQTVGYFTNWQN